MTDYPQTYCGYVAIVGRPNVGKSTLLNHLLGQKISITSRKPQTTRHRLLGIKTVGNKQTIFVDTPGLHSTAKKAINRTMNRAASSTLVGDGVDLVLFVVEKNLWSKADDWVLQQVKKTAAPVILVVNKTDQLADKTELLPYLAAVKEQMDFAEIIPVSALKGIALDTLQTCIDRRLPPNPHIFTDDQITDRSERFIVTECVREKLVRQLGSELPYATAVQIETWRDSGKSIHIDALIWVERDSQKRIVIGSQGARLKKIGSDAREDIEKILARKVMLKLWVKVKSGWSDDERMLRSFGYDER